VSKMVIDLHIHTKKYSSCSEMSAEEAALEAKKIGLDGICFTEHNKTWDLHELSEVGKKCGMLIFSGIEVDTSEGHVVVFGLNKNFQGITPVEDLRKMVDEAGGYMIAAHPFRGFLLFGFSKLQMDVDSACKNPIFNFVDDMEIFSGRQTPKEDAFSAKACKKLNLRGVGGSDAHSTKDIGKCVTIFENEIKRQDDLLRELKAGNFTSAYFRT